MPDGGFLSPEQPVAPPAPEAPPVAAEEVSSVEADEQALEQLPEIKDAFLEEEVPVTPAAQTPAVATEVTPPVAAPKDEVVKEVEEILGEGLGDYFAQMPEAAKLRFRQKGEEVAWQIADMVRSFRVQVKKVLILIRGWLLAIPGVNKFFLEQEAKIKTDRIIELDLARREDFQKKP